MTPSLVPGILSGRILVAVDGSEHADRAIRWAADQAALENRELVVAVIGEASGSVADEAVATAQGLHPDLAVTGHVVSGDPRQVLIDASEHVHLLVLGSRGRGSVRSMLLGSVSATVSAHAACPVVVCRPTTDDQTRNGVVVGADGTPESLPVIEFAYRQASLRNLPLTVLHSFWDAATAVAEYRSVRGLPAEEPDLEDLRATLAESVAGFAEDYPDVSVTLTLKHGFADEALSSRRSSWDLIVVGHQPMTSLARILTSSIANTVIERADTNVAVVPQPTSS